jgi:predicted acyl esterase
MIIERDVAVGVRGGVTVYADVFRPANERPAPPLIAWSPDGKHAGSQVTERYPDGGVAPGQLSEYTAFESPDPVYWTARGYAVVNADIPGSWHSGAVFADGPVALGWLRASHRELDQRRSTPWQPVLAHQRELRPRRGEIVPLEIEILPSGTHFGPGETLRLVIQGTDIYRQPRPLMQTFHDDSVNRGPHVIHTGGRFDSHLLIPHAPR